MTRRVILFGDPGDEQPAPWLDEVMRSAKAEIESTPEQLRREPGDTKANAEPFAQQPERDPLRPVADTVVEGLVAEGRTLEAEILLLRLRSAVADKEWAIACANMETVSRDGWSCDWNAGMREAHPEIESVLARLAGLTEEK